MFLKRRNSRKSCRGLVLHFGFTLIELLVVIAIIALLVSILLPSLNKARDLAKRVVCMTNLKNMSMAFLSYADENADIYPQDDTYEYWTNPIVISDTIGPIGLGYIWKSYLDDKDAFFCPQDKIRHDTYHGRNWKTESPYEYIEGSYCLRGRKQSSSPDSQPGKTLSGCADKALVSCYFLYHPVHPVYALTYHDEEYPVLFGGGSVQLLPLPDAVDPENPNDIWSYPIRHAEFWDHFDECY